MFAGIVAVLLVVQALSIFVLKSILENTIKFEYGKREQAVIIASLFAEWIDNPSERKELNRLAWEASLWLPDDLALEVNKRLNNAPDAKDIREIIIEIKGLIHGRKSKLEAKNMVYFPKQ